jgi:hypothetical protein
MKKLLTIIFIFISLQVQGTIYYISPTGNDETGDGSIVNPWFSIEKAFYVLTAGDTCYIRGGVYYYDKVQYHNVGGHDGTPNAHIYFINYPGEKPIFDFSKNKPASVGGEVRGIYLYNAHYIEFKGITIRHLWQRLDNVLCIAFGAHTVNYLKITNCVVHDISGGGFTFWNCDSVMVYNCDAYECRDTLRSDTFSGNGGSGFTINSDNVATQRYGYFYGCRAWNCSDEAFGGTNEGPEIYENCWAFCNGWAFPDSPYPIGQGWKFGFEDTEYALKRIVNCVAAYNKTSGFNTNGVYRGFEAEWYNNTSYKNYQGFVIYNTTSSDEFELSRVLKNNIAYANTGFPITVTTGGVYSHDHNSWDIPLTLTDADFISVDSTGITAPRQADGSLPDNDCYNYFLRPSSSSQAIDVGTDVGLDYEGTAPDIGAFEYVAQDPPVEPTFRTIILQHSGKIIMHNGKIITID